MSTISTLDFRVQNAKNFIDSLYGEEGENDAYVFIGKPTPWEDENRPPVPINNLEHFYDVYHQMLSLRRIQGNECFPMFRRITWQSGSIYDYYRHDYSVVNPAFSGATILENANFYVINSKNDVYVCLFNSNNLPSSVEPSNDNYDPFFTTDGYQWLKLFSIKSQVLYDYSTLNFLPVTTDGANIDTQVRTGGEITTVVIDSRGDGYTINPGGTQNEIETYYCKIVGDGDGAVASVRVTPPSIENPEIGQGIGAVRVVRPGSMYSYATLDFTAGRCYASLADLDAEVNGLDPRGDGRFRSTVIINPPNGWGYDIARQLSATTAGVFSSFAYNLTDFFPETTFRQIGILQNPEVNNPQMEGTNTLSGVFAYKVTEIEGQPEFIIGETIYQQRFNEELQRTQTAKGTIVGWDEGEKIIRYIQIPSQDVDDDGILYQFDSSTFIHGATSNKVVEPTSYNGSLAGLFFVDGFADTEVKRYTGHMLYISNISPVLRAPTQTERISLLVQF
jgi:hypothetical protein